jgi:hypothetical protein
MGHPYRGPGILEGLIPPLSALIPLAFVDAFAVLLPTAPWMCERGHPFRMLLAPLLGLAIGLLLSVQAVIWYFLRKWRVGSKADADAAFANVFAPPAPVAIHGPIDEPAIVLVEWIPEGRRGPMAWFDVYVDDRPVWSVTGDRLTAVMVPEGRH